MKTDVTKLNPIDRNGFQVWLLGRPRLIQELAAATPPWFVYRVKPGAPYSTTGPGTEGWVYGYNEDGTVCFTTTYLQVQQDHDLGDGLLLTGRGQVHEVPEGVSVHMDPQWLEPIHEVKG